MKTLGYIERFKQLINDGEVTVPENVTVHSDKDSEIGFSVKQGGKVFSIDYQYSMGSLVWYRNYELLDKDGRRIRFKDWDFDHDFTDEDADSAL